MTYLARDEYVSAAAQTDYVISFPYLSETHLMVYVGGVLSTAWDLATDQLLRLDAAPTEGTTVVIVRETSPETALVTYESATTITATDLNTTHLQALYLAQEALDRLQSAIGLDSTLQWDAKDKRIRNVGAPTESHNAVRKADLDAAVIAAGAIPTPDNPADNGKALLAQGGTYDWGAVGGSYTAFTGDTGSGGATGLVPAPAAGDAAAAKFLGAGGSWATVFPTGAVILTARSSAPTGWLLCQGQAVNRVTYAALFSAIGTTYGVGNGTTTFNVPDLRGRVAIGVDAAGVAITTASTDGGNADTLGGKGGSETHTLALSEMPAHTHTYNKYGVSGNKVESGQNFNGLQSNTQTGSAGGGLPHSNTQPWLALNYIIKT